MTASFPPADGAVMITSRPFPSIAVPWAGPYLKGVLASRTPSCVGGDGGNRTRDEGFADLCLTTWLRRLGAAAGRARSSEAPRRRRRERSDTSPTGHVPTTYVAGRV